MRRVCAFSFDFSLVVIWQHFEFINKITNIRINVLICLVLLSLLRRKRSIIKLLGNYIFQIAIFKVFINVELVL